jgi:hypothetical protein
VMMTGTGGSNNKDAEDVLLIQEVLTYSWSTNGDRKQGSLFQLS